MSFQARNIQVLLQNELSSWETSKFAKKLSSLKMIKYLEGSIAPNKFYDGDKRLRVLINGDNIKTHEKFIFVPEEWERNERDQRAILDVASSSMSLLLNILVMMATVLGIIYWTNNKITTMLVLYIFSPLLIVRIVSFINQLPSLIASFSTAQPYNNQLGVLIAGTLVGGLFISMIPCILVASSHFQINEQKKNKEKPGLLEGILIGIGLSGVFVMTNTLQPNLSPEWPNLFNGASRVPFLSILNNFGGFLVSAGFTTFIVLFI